MTGRPGIQQPPLRTHEAAAPRIRSASDFKAECFAAMATAGFDESDPMRPVLVAFSSYIDFLEQRMLLNEERLAATARESLAFVKEARQAADLEERRLVAACRNAEAKLVADFSQSIQKDVLASLERKRDWEESKANSGTAMLVILASLVSAFFFNHNGYENGVASVHETETGLQAAFRQDPSSAREWMQLMQGNDIKAALDRCSPEFPPRAPFDGHTACMVPLWLGKPPSVDLPPTE